MGLADTRRQLKTIAEEAVDTVILGLKDEAADDDFFASLVDNPTIVIKPAKYTGVDNFLKTSEFEVEVKLYYSYPNNQDEDFTALEDLYDAILAAFCDMDNYIEAGASVPLQIEPFGETEELRQTPRVLATSMKLMFRGSTAA